MFIKQNPSYDPPKKKGRMRIRSFFKSHSFFFFAFVPFYSFLILGHCFQAFSWDKVNSRNEEQKPAPGQNGCAGGRRADGQAAEQAARRARGRLGDWPDAG